MGIRKDLIQTLENQAHIERTNRLTVTLLENLQQQLDPGMAGWTPTGVSGESPMSDIRDVDPSVLRQEAFKSFYRDPHGRNIVRTPVKFIIGGGCVVDFDEKNEEALEKLNSWWKKCRKSSKWFSFMREFATRSYRDGEVFVRRWPNNEGPLKLRFIEPKNIEDKDIVVDGDDAEEILNYNIKGKTVPASDIVHFKTLNVDRNVLRGRPSSESSLQYLTKYGKWLEARMTLSQVRTSVALIQEVQGSNTDLLRIRSNQQTTRNRPGESDKAKMLRPGTIIRGTPGVQYKMLSPNLDARDASEDGRTLLLGVGAGQGLPDTFVTNDFCHSIETQVLTERGWLYFQDLKASDRLGTMNPNTGELEFQPATGLNHFRHTGPMYQFNGRRFSFCVTPNHELFVSGYHKGHKFKESLRLHQRPLSEFRKEKISNLTASLYIIPGNVEWNGGEDEPLYSLPNGTTVEMEIWMEFLAYVLTEGCITDGMSGHTQITQKTEHKIPIIEECLQQLPWAYTTTISGGSHVFRIWDRQLREHLVETIGTPEGSYSYQKHFPEFLWNLDKKYLEIFLDALILGDGGEGPRDGLKSSRFYRTTSPRMADEAQRLAMMLGYATTLTKSEGNMRRGNGHHPTYCLNMSNGHPQLLETKRLEVLNWYDGYVWCATVPNGLLITRLNGKPFISGNSRSNFASSVVAQNPAIREFEEAQQLIAEPLTDIIMWFLEDGLEKGEIPDSVSDKGKSRPINLEFDLNFPPLLRRDLGQENNAYALMNERKALSLRSWTLKMGFDPDQERRYIKDEEEAGLYPQPEEPKAKSVEPTPKRVEDRQPRQTKVTGSGESKKITVSVLPKKEKMNGTAQHFDLEYHTVRPEQSPEMEDPQEESSAL